MMRTDGSVNFRRRRGERGVTIILVTFGVAFLVIAVAALAIDVVTLYNARNEARQAADAAALAGAKVLANSGLTSDTSISSSPANIKTLAQNVAIAVATQNKLGGRAILSSEVNVTFPNQADASFAIAPQVSVTITRTDLPTFFARAWGTRILTVSATGTAEALNASNSSSLTSGGNPLPLAPQCVKPWAIPNKDPVPGHTGLTLFNVSTGQPTSASGMVGQSIRLQLGCYLGSCYPPIPGRYYYLIYSPTTPPAGTLPGSCFLWGGCDYEENIVACNPQPITCGPSNNATIYLPLACGTPRPTQTHDGLECLIHASSDGPGRGQDCLNADAGDCGASPTSSSTQIFAGSGNPLVQAGVINTGDAISTSSSLVTIPVFDETAVTIPSGTSPSNINIHVIGFIQGFITSFGPDNDANGYIYVRIVNLSGCGSSASGTAVLGDGTSPVPVHLISN